MNHDPENQTELTQLETVEENTENNDTLSQEEVESTEVENKIEESPKVSLESLPPVDESPLTPESDETVKEEKAELEKTQAVEETEAPVEIEAPVEDSTETEKPAEDTPDSEIVADAVPKGPDVLQELIDDEAKFDEQLKIASPLELIVLLEKIESQVDIRNHISKVGLIKRRFDKLNKNIPEEEQDKAIQGRFNSALTKFNRKRSILEKEIEQERKGNTAIKNGLLDELKLIVEKEDVQAISAVRDIQKRWRETGWVLKDDLVSLNTRYKHFLDVFYNLRGHYHELLDMDRKYNQDEKQKLIDEANSLIPENFSLPRDTWAERSERIQNLLEIWKTIGPAPKEINDEIYETFRAALDKFYELRQQYYGSQDAERKLNGEKKQALLEEMRPFSTFAGKSAKEWNSKTKVILALQKQWMEIGSAPRDINKVLWKDYRAICDAFFNAKTTYFKEFDVERDENLKLKIALCEKAEELSKNTDWKKTSIELKKLQKDWKDIGPVSEKHSNKIWKRFRKACDEFFGNRDKQFEGAREEEKANLDAKKALIDELKAITEKGLDAEKAMAAMGEIRKKWKEVGFVPFKAKEKISKAWQKALDAFFEQPSLKGNDKDGLKLESKLNMIQDDEFRKKRIKDEIFKIERRVYAIKQDYDSYSTNIQMVSKGKSGDGLRKMIQDKIDAEGEKLTKLEAKLKTLRDLLKNPPKKEEPAAEVQEVVPEAKEESAKEETPVVEEKPAEKEAPAAEEKPVAEEPSQNEENLVVKESPAAEETPVVEEKQETEASETPTSEEQPEV